MACATIPQAIDDHRDDGMATDAPLQPSPPTATSHPSASSRGALKEGELVLYRRGQSFASVRIVRVHYDAPPPYYTVERTDESSSGDIITDRNHLFAASELDSTPPPPSGWR